MNTERLIKVLECRLSVNVQSDNKYSPKSRDEVGDCIMNVFDQYCEFKKKKYNLTLSTSLDTDELEDMDIAILICEIECGFGIEPIPSDDLRAMSTFENVADYVYNNLPVHATNEKRLDENVNQKNEKKLGLCGWLFGTATFVFVSWYSFEILTEGYKLSDLASCLISVIVGLIAFAIAIGMVLFAKD